MKRMISLAACGLVAAAAAGCHHTSCGRGDGCGGGWGHGHGGGHHTAPHIKPAHGVCDCAPVLGVNPCGPYGGLAPTVRPLHAAPAPAAVTPPVPVAPAPTK